MSKLNIIVLAIAFTVLLVIVAAVVTNAVELWIILTMLGSESAYLVLSLLAYYLYRPSQGVRLVAAVVLAGTLVILAKHVLNMPRPPPSLWRVSVSGPGFPSGHTCVATAFWVEVYLAVRSLPYVLLSTTVILGVGLSRIGLRVHYPRDVIGGFLLGFGVALLVYLASSRLGEKRMCYLVSCLATLAAVLAYHVGASRFELWALLGLALALPLYSEKVDSICPRTRLWKRMVAVTLILAIALVLSKIARLTPLTSTASYLLMGMLMLRIVPEKTCSAG